MAGPNATTKPVTDEIRLDERRAVVAAHKRAHRSTSFAVDVVYHQPNRLILFRSRLHPSRLPGSHPEYHPQTCLAAKPFACQKMFVRDQAQSPTEPHSWRGPPTSAHPFARSP